MLQQLKSYLRLPKLAIEPRAERPPPSELLKVAPASLIPSMSSGATFAITRLRRSDFSTTPVMETPAPPSSFFSCFTESSATLSAAAGALFDAEADAASGRAGVVLEAAASALSVAGLECFWPSALRGPP